MKAAISDHYGGPEVIQIRDIDPPKPSAGQILIKVHASTVTRTDDGMLRPIPGFARLFLGLRKPKLKILGMDFAGEVVKVASDVTRFQPGDRVFGLSSVRFGAHAEYVCVAADSAVALIPEQIPCEQAVVCEGAWYANNNLRKMNLQAGKKILIYGASGAVGTAAVQLARYYGAEVTAVVDTPRIELAAALGADRVIDYTQCDFTQIGDSFDCVFDAVGKAGYFHCKKLLKPEGIFASTELKPWLPNGLFSLWHALTRRNRVFVALPTDSKRLVDFMAQRLTAGEFEGVFDRSYTLDSIAEAYRYVAKGLKTGIVVINN